MRLVDRLQLLKALLDAGLPLVGDEHLGGREGAVVCEQWVHTIAALVIGDGLRVQGPLDVRSAGG